MSETWLKNNTNIVFSGYNVFRTDREDGYGGVAILSKKSFAFSNTKTFYNIAEVMCTSINIKLDKQLDINFYSIYAKPNLKISEREWTKFFDSLQRPFILGGDFNCHHCVWGCSLIDVAGNNLLSAIENCNLTILNTGEETLIRSPLRTNKSAVDLTICSTDIVTACNWKTEMISIGSDHIPILINFVHNTSDNVSRETRWNLNKADWRFFSNILENKIAQNNKLTYDEFIQELNYAASLAIPLKKKTFNPKFNKMWWNQACENALNAQKEALLQYKRISNLENYVEFKKRVACAKNVIKKAKEILGKNFVII